MLYAVFQTAQFTMKQLLNRLDFLCIEIISRNIYRYGKSPRSKWKLGYSNNGERIMKASLANSFYCAFDEDSFAFILNNFNIKKFKINPRICEKLTYFNFLNQQKIDDFSFDYMEPIKLKNGENFSLSTNRLDVNFLRGSEFTEDVFNFFFGLSVLEEIKITKSAIRKQNLEHIENIVLALVRNSSENLQTLILNIKYTSISFREQLIEIISRKVNLNNIRLAFIDEFRTRDFPDLFSKGLKNLTHFSFLDFNKNWNFQLVNNCLESLNSIEKIAIWLPDSRNLEDLDAIDITFSLLKLKSCKSLKEVQICLPDAKLFEKEVSDLLKSCQNLTRILFTEKLSHKTVDGTLFESLVPSAGNLNEMNFRYSHFTVSEEMTCLKNLSVHSSLQKLCLYRVKFESGLFLGFLDAIKNLKSLTLLNLDSCLFSINELNFFPKVLKKFEKLESFNVRLYQADEETVLKILDGLRFSCKTLKEISISLQHPIRAANCNELLNFLNNCHRLTKINISVLMDEERMGDIFSILEKFQNMLQEIDLSFCYAKGKLKELLNFLSGCTQLEVLSGDELDNQEVLCQVVDSLENSKYTIKELNFFELRKEQLSIKFPNYLLL